MRSPDMGGYSNIDSIYINFEFIINSTGWIRLSLLKGILDKVPSGQDPIPLPRASGNRPFSSKSTSSHDTSAGTSFKRPYQRKRRRRQITSTARHMLFRQNLTGIHVLPPNLKLSASLSPCFRQLFATARVRQPQRSSPYFFFVPSSAGKLSTAVPSSF